MIANTKEVKDLFNRISVTTNELNDTQLEHNSVSPELNLDFHKKPNLDRLKSATTVCNKKGMLNRFLLKK